MTLKNEKRSVEGQDFQNSKLFGKHNEKMNGERLFMMLSRLLKDSMALKEEDDTIVM